MTTTRALAVVSLAVIAARSAEGFAPPPPAVATSRMLIRPTPPPPPPLSLSRIAAGSLFASSSSSSSSSSSVGGGVGVGRINTSIDLDSAKVVTQAKLLDAEDGTKKGVVYCRCWKSGTFPLCDGGHVAHNRETGDNVGPLILSIATTTTASPPPAPAAAAAEEKEKADDDGGGDSRDRTTE